MTMTIRRCIVLLALTCLPSRGFADDEKEAYSEKLGDKVIFDMITIPAGRLRMGSPADEAFRNHDEGPQVEVEVGAFWMGKCEVTWEEYNLFAQDYQLAKKLGADIPKDREADAVSFPTPVYQEKLGRVLEWGVNGKMPAVCMTQFAAKQYTKWLSKRTGRFYRLPTEAEWEHAARAGSTTRWSFGNDEKRLDEHAWHLGNSEERYHEVGRKKPNAWGLHDIYGNLAEWCIDAHDAGHYEKLAALGKPVASNDAINWPKALDPRIVRGGHFEAEARECRSAARWFSDKSWKANDPKLPKSVWWQTDIASVGFRVVRPAKEPAADEKQKYWDPDLDSIREILKDDLQARMLVESK